MSGRNGTGGVLLPMPGNEALADALARETGWRLAGVETRRFPDDETYLRLDLGPEPIPEAGVAIVCTLDRPDAKTLPLLFAAATARELGAPRVGLVAPYLAYMRQDARFQPGEAVTSRVYAGLLSSALDWLLTIDPHLHRFHDLGDLYAIPARVVHAAPALARWIADHVDDPLLVGPDEESRQWVADVASRAGAPFVVLEKVRRGDRDVQERLPSLEGHHGRTPVILDDIVSSARTMARTAAGLVAAGLTAPVCVGVHGIFAGDALEVLRVAGVARVVTTDSVPHDTNAIEVSPLLVPPLLELASAKGP